MTNINCSLDCIYQIDGKCSYDIISDSILCTDSECAYYKKADQKYVLNPKNWTFFD